MQELDPGGRIDLKSGVSITRCGDYESMFSMNDPDDETVVLEDEEIREIAELAGFDVSESGSD